MNRLVIPQRIFTALAGGGGGGEACRFLAAAARNRHLLLLKALVDAARSTEIKAYFDLLARMHASHPEPVDAVLCYPAVGAWALSAVRALHRSEGDPHLAQMPVLLATAAIRAGLPFETQLPSGAEAAVLPSLGRSRLGSGGCRIQVIPGEGAIITGSPWRVEVPADPSHESASWQAMRHITVNHPNGGWQVAVDDLDPYRFPPGSRGERDSPMTSSRSGTRSSHRRGRFCVPPTPASPTKSTP